MKRIAAAVVPLCLLSFSLALACATPTAGAGSAGAEAAADAPLFERLGGLPAIEAVVDELFARVAQDTRINAAFAGAPLPRTRRRLIEMVCQATGGPCTYSGRDMKTSHAGMGITGAQFDALAGHLVAALDKLKVPEREKGELLAIVGSTRADIVEEP
jgi:hemoglobin